MGIIFVLLLFVNASKWLKIRLECYFVNMNWSMWTKLCLIFLLQLSAGMWAVESFQLLGGLGQSCQHQCGLVGDRLLAGSSSISPGLT